MNKNLIQRVCPGTVGRTRAVKRPLRIAMLSVHSSPLGKLGTQDTGGMSIYICELSRELGRAGHRVDIFTSGGGEGEIRSRTFSENVRVTEIGIGPDGNLSKNALFQYLPRFFEGMDMFARNRGLHYDLIHSHYWLSGLVGMLARKRWNVPHFMMFHTMGMAKNISCAGEREPVVRLLSERKLCRESSRIIVSTDRERELLLKYGPISSNKVGLVPCGVNLNRFRPLPRDFSRKRLGLGESDPVVLYVGRFAPVKGIERLLAAAAHLRHRGGMRLIIAGGDGEEDRSSRELRRLARKLNVNGMVRFAGSIDHDDLPLFYSSADVLVVPSYYESFGLVALEALACGTPVVATRVGAIDGIIGSMQSGTVVESPTPRSLALAIEKYLSTSADTPLVRGRIRAMVHHYDWSIIASAVMDEYALSLPREASWITGYDGLGKVACGRSC